jgi:elongator complex protein 3
MSSSDSAKTSYALAVSFIVSELIKAYESGSECNFTQLKGNASRKFRLKGIPKMADILQALPLEYRSKLWPFLKTKPVRTASGVAVVAVMSKPHQCPHIAYTGNVCVYCPGGVLSGKEKMTSNFQVHTAFTDISLSWVLIQDFEYSTVRLVGLLF